MAIDERKKFFLNRVSRRIFRTFLPGGSPADEKIYREGQIILNRDHAEYLYERERTWKNLGFKITYFGSRPERDIAELKEKTPA